VATGTLLTVSHVPGVDNTLADAISREFKVPSGNEIRAQIEASAPRVQLISQLWASLASALRTPSPTPLETDHAVRMALEFVTGTNSEPRT
jgi:hypothetical protein